MSDVVVFKSIKEFIQYRDGLASSKKIGFVPTMGALHQGHASLIQKSAAENDVTILSIFVNPTQFNNPEDLKKYPRTLDNDLKIASEAGVQVVITPQYEDIYKDNYRYKLTENEFSKKLCGAHRPGHFDGVLTVVMKLLQIVSPANAYFGEKDFQQLKLISDMVNTFFLRPKIIECPTLRETDGLAMSSRNIRLSNEARKKAAGLYKCLREFTNFSTAKEFLSTQGIELEYFEEHFNRRFIAAHIEGVRLIDNVKLN